MSLVNGITSTVVNALLPQNDNTDENLLIMSDKSEVYDWLRNTFVPIWADPQCGDGECEDQTEYPGFGRFGCTADCGRACQMLLATT